MRQIEIACEDAGKKIESFLKKQFPIGYVRKLFRKHGVRLNGQKAKPDDLLRSGDRLQLYIPFQKTAKAASQAGPKTPLLPVVCEDERIIVIDKPAGLAVHEARGILRRDTVIGLLEAQYREQNIRPRLVHRIDQDTSGLLLVAKSLEAATEFESSFEKSAVEKIYIALVAGRLVQNAGTIDCSLPGRDGQPVRALTHFKVTHRFGDTTLVQARIDTGRMHQIRLHFAKLSHPVVMDERHGDFAFNKKFRKTYGLKRQFLHAARLSLVIRDKKTTWSAPLPEDLADVLEALRAG
jgi:23S rRNA pseudouridine955/2504/2580 synthase